MSSMRVRCNSWCVIKIIHSLSLWATQCWGMMSPSHNCAGAGVCSCNIMYDDSLFKQCVIRIILSHAGIPTFLACTLFVKKKTAAATAEYILSLICCLTEQYFLHVLGLIVMIDTHHSKDIIYITWGLSEVFSCLLSTVLTLFYWSN